MNEPHVVLLDPQTGYYYYGARYYDPGASIFLSVDPLAEKYPNINPYVYVANNPINFIDPDGRDYRVFFNSATKTVTIKATYYALGKDVQSAQRGSDFWNNQSGNFVYSVGSGRNKIDYQVNFELSVVEVAVNPNVGELGSLNLAKGSNQTGEANVYSVVNDGDLRSDQNGVTAGGNFIRIKESRTDTETGSHEMGHSLGLEHSEIGLMTPSSTDPNRSNNIYAEEVMNIIQKPLNGNSSGGGKGSLINDTNFSTNSLNTGEVKRNENSN